MRVKKERKLSRKAVNIQTGVYRCLYISDAVSQGETVVVLEAMKMENALPAPASGTIKAINFSSGDSVAKGDVLCVIG